MTTSPIERAAESFAAELARHRTERGLSKKQLATLMGFDPSYVSHVEGRRHRPTEDFARRAEAVLEASGAIWQRFREYDELRHGRSATPARDHPAPGQWMPPGTGLIVEREQAVLTYTDDAYHCLIRRELYNAGTEPVTRYLVRVAVDRYPNDPGRSNRHHREHPLTFAELQLRAHRDDGSGQPEPMHWRAKHDRDAFKEIWLLFENDEGRFPLYPGDRVTIEYAYQVGREKWGPWFQRAVRLPTRHLAVRLDLPTALDPQVWGLETSLSAEEGPLRRPVVRQNRADRAIFDWATEDPPLNARYRLQWRFRSRPPDSDPGGPAGVARVRASDRMRGLGIVQRGADLLRQPSRQFDLPAEEGVAREVVERLGSALVRLDELHPFSKGVGIAAPQLGLAWAAAVVRPPDRAAEPVVLLNPRVVDSSPETDEQYEGCLSFFDHRGLVPRPLRIDVEHAQWDGARLITSFEFAMARLVAHEIDHLEGRLYVDRMTPGVPLVPVEEYRETGTPWRY
ncbi:peptide deformylase [Micromonospora carbonacea]|uniref:Peptide deformylase n=1 Tax=Micromonospora carbonacea TaxID=47853 RepID=A0A7H8XTB7_9ACTN|nr:peptide deformylase [Micromonospora carbonacea]MBB5830013.1 peptide deformylase [Micromonospora carbonacea]QLD28045.1 peptide deformylase [Micromonospora carbonacea]